MFKDKIKPVGSRAKSHLKLCTNASVVTTGAWAYQNVGIMLSDIRIWRWAVRGVQLYLFASISSILKESAVNFHYRELAKCVAVAFSLDADIRKVAESHVSCNGATTVCTMPFLKLGPCTNCGGHLARQTSRVARLDIIGCEFT